jgi:hypothetical protein
MTRRHRPTEGQTDDAEAMDRALALLAIDQDARPFPSAAAVRLESELRLEERRIARRACLVVGLHAGALTLCLSLLAAVFVLEPAPVSQRATFGGAGSLCAAVAVVICIWNLFRCADESAVPLS